MTSRKSNKAILILHKKDAIKYFAHSTDVKQWSAEVTRCQNLKCKATKRRAKQYFKRRNKIYECCERCECEELCKSKCTKCQAALMLTMMMAGRLRIVWHKAHETPLRLKNEIVPSNQNEIDPHCPVSVCFYAVRTIVLDVSNINKNHLVNETENRWEPKSEKKKRKIMESWSG